MTGERKQKCVVKNFIICTFTKYYLVSQNNLEEMNGNVAHVRRGEMLTEF